MNLRRVSFRQAVQCEQGTAKRCQCRCRKALHGAKRFGDAPTYRDFMSLPKDDPHQVQWRADQTPALTFPPVEEVRDAESRAHATEPA